MLLTALLMACSLKPQLEEGSVDPERNCPAVTPAIDETASALGACLAADTSPDEAALLLERWGRIDPGEWGGVAFYNVLPSMGDELLITYHADLSQVIWNPAGKMALLQLDSGGWSVIFESPSPGDRQLDGQDSLEGNWSYHLQAAGDVTGDGLDDLLIKQQWSNGTHGYASFTKLVTAEGAVGEPLRFILQEDSSDIYPLYRIVDGTVESTLIIGASRAIERTHRLDSETFSLISQSIYPEAAKLSVAMPDGAMWYAFDSEDGSLRRHSYGLYRVKESNLLQLQVPYFISALERLSDGRLYVGGTNENGAIISRLDGLQLVNVLKNDYAPVEEKFWRPLDMYLTDEGPLWVAGGFQLFRFGQDTSNVYPINVWQLTPGLDGSIWALGWDGKADSSCCFYQVDGNTVSSYTYQEPLSVPADLERRIRAMRESP